MNPPERPLDPVTSIKVKIGLLVALSLLAAAVVIEVGRGAGLPPWLTLPVTLAAALGVTQWLARGMTSPLREMTYAAARMATGDYSGRVTASSADEVGRLARAFNTMSTDLATADLQRRQLVATVSHELRTPLAAQRALLENLVDGVVRPDDAALQAALAQSERLSTLVGDLLDVSRVDEGAASLDLAAVHVADLLAAVVAEAAISERGRQVRIETSVEPEGLEVRADAARLSQLLANLVDNAVRHSPIGGTVRVSAQTDPARGTWSLQVADQGPGFPPGATDRLFTRFGVGDDSSGGTGLGLAIASWVCRLHGGSIEAVQAVEVQPQPGAIVRAVLPLDPDQPVIHDSGQEHAVTSTTTNQPGPVPEPPSPATTLPQPGPPQPPPPVIEGIFGPFWPENGPKVATLALWGSVGVGALAAAVLPYRDFGVGWLLVLLAAGGLVLSRSVRARQPWTVLSTLLCLGLGSLVVLRAAEWLTTLALLVVAVLVTTALTGARTVPAMVASGASWVLSGIRGLPLLGRTLTVTRRHRLAWPVLRTAVISLVALVVFGGLFASGDAVVGSWARELLPELHIADSLVLRTFVWFMVGGVVLAACYLALNPPRVELLTTSARPVARTWEWLVPVGVVVATFVVFMVAQMSAMWGGHEFVQRTTGMSYAESVHQGFAQLTVATALTLLTISIVARRASRRTARDRLLLRVWLGVLCVLTLVVVASAMYRMSVYQQAYGFTVMRVLVDAFELWLGLLVVLVMIAGIRLRGAWLPRAALATGAVFLLVIGLANPEAWVAQRNIDRYADSGRLDVRYLSTLGADAVPVITAGLPDDLARCAVGWGVDTEQDQDWLSWNLGRARAAQEPLVLAPQVSPPSDYGLGDCVEEVTP